MVGLIEKPGETDVLGEPVPIKRVGTGSKLDGAPIRIPFVDMNDLPKEYRQEFSDWMRGQTAPLLVEYRVEHAVYPWDLEKWVKHKKGESVAWE